MTLAQRATPAQAAVPVRVNDPVRAREKAPPSTPRAEDSIPRITSYADLPPLYFWSLNLHRGLELKLYDATGHIDEKAATELDGLLGDARSLRSIGRVEVKRIERRTMQLVVKAAYHFKSKRVDIVSGYRNPRRRHEGQHGRGFAIDFRLEGVSPPEIAAYLRTHSRVGVGFYTHPKTQFVHCDSREPSFHWVDASPPGRRFRERPYGNPKTFTLADSRYERASDWPEGTEPPADVLGLLPAWPSGAVADRTITNLPP